MDRRYNNPGGSTSHIARASNSFIPTTSPPTKLPQHQIQQIALQSQLQAQSHLQMRMNMNNGPDNPNHNGNQSYQSSNAANHHRQSGTLIHRNAAIPTNSHLQQQQQHQGGGQSRSLNKQYSHYGNTTTNHSSHQIPSNHSNGSGNTTFYGTLGSPNQNSSSIPNPNWRYSNQSQSHLQKEIPTINHQSIQPVIKQIQQQHLSNKISQHYQPAETEGLPQTLIDSMRTLFDILDDSKMGKIRLSDIETRWENNEGNGQNGSKGNTGAEPLIKMGVMGYLRKVTPPDGLLTFDRFCAGLRLSLLTNNNSTAAHNQLNSAHSQAQLIKQPNPQFSLQQHVRNMTSNLQSANNKQNPIANIKSFNGNMENPPPPATNASRISKIPSMSTSRLPTNNASGLPVSPNSRHTGNPYNNNLYGNLGYNVYPNGVGRQGANPEQGTTVAMVHQPPPPNAKPSYAHGKDHMMGTMKTNNSKQIASVRGKENRNAAKNGSLDNLITDNNEIQNRESRKDRPISAPLLDTSGSCDDENEQGGYYKTNTMNNNKGERSSTQHRERESEERNLNRRNAERKPPGEEMAFGKRVVSLVTPRQRTLSMPQLQPNKLNPKPINLEDDNPDNQASVEGAKNQSQENSKSNFRSQIVPPSQISSGSSGIHRQKSVETDRLIRHGNQKIVSQDNNDPPPPPKPPRNTILTINTYPANNAIVLESQLSGGSTNSGTLTPSKPEIRNVLESWQKEKVGKDPEDSGDIILTQGNENQKSSLAGNENETKVKSEKKTGLRRRETPRRHTVQSGIDFATLKRLKQLEQERDVLQQGNSYIDNAKDWYMKQLDMVEEKIGLLTKGAPISEYWSEGHEERLNLLGCRISEVNSMLTALTDGTSQLHLHMNLQIPSHLSMKTITRLKDQNRQLTQEVSDCGQRVTQLETEKAILLRQLFHQNNNIHPDETVYM